MSRAGVLLPIVIACFSLLAKGQDTILVPKAEQVNLLYEDSLFKRMANNFPDIKKSALDAKGVAFQNPLSVKDLDFKWPTPGNPILRSVGGEINYVYQYRSNVDTPFFSQNVSQHQVNGKASFLVADFFPVSIRTQIRRSNVIFFRNITDVQVEYDAVAMQTSLYKSISDNINRFADTKLDTLASLAVRLKEMEIKQLVNIPNSQFTIQQLVEAKEMLNIPSLTIDKSLPDSLASVKSDSLISAAKKYIQLYNLHAATVGKLQSELDSLKLVVQRNVASVNRVKKLAASKFSNADQLETILKDRDLSKVQSKLLPRRIKWLLGIRRFSVGRSALQYTDLTARNISINGFNFEYNSWYYFSLTAGLVDFRFRDYLIQNGNRPKQYFYMARAGIGKILGTHVIASLYKGKKQVYVTGGINGNYPFNVTGVSISSRYQFGKLGFVKAEVAASVAPDFRTIPVKNNKWNLRDKHDKAYAMEFSFTFPRTGSKTSGTYKYTGANFQSFSTFQTNATNHSWSARIEQNFLKKKLKLVAAARRNDFANPFLVLPYQSATVFKTVQLSFRKRKWPAFSIAYMPVTQLSEIGERVYENSFNALNGTLHYQYKLGSMSANTTLLVTRFFNKVQDTLFLYYNSRNVYLNQYLVSPYFTAVLAYTNTSNGVYQLHVFEEQIKVPFHRLAGNAAFGTKLYNMRGVSSTVGFLSSLSYLFKKKTSLSFYYERGYIPGIAGKLVLNNMGSIQLTKYL